MAYAPIESAVQTLLQGLAIFSPADVTRGDFRVLDRGSAPYAVLTPGPISGEVIGTFQGARGPSKAKVSWDMDLWLFEKYTDDKTAWPNFEITRDAVIAKLNGAALVGLFPSVGRVLFRSGTEPVELNDEDNNGPYFIQQVLRFTIDEVA